MDGNGAYGAGNALRALVVDDSAFMRKMVSTILREGGVDVADTARDGQEALEKARTLARARGLAS